MMEDVTTESLAIGADRAAIDDRIGLYGLLVAVASYAAHQAMIFQSVRDRVRMPLVIVGRADRVECLNAAAELLLGEGDGVALKNGRIAIADGGCHDRFRRHLACLRMAARGEEGAVDLSIPRPSGRRSYHLTVQPLTAVTDAGILGQTASMLVLIVDPDAEPALSEPRLMAMFGLTRAEARLARALGSGLSLEEIAERHRVARSTLRTQLLSAFAKTGTSRQSELVRLLLKLDLGAGPAVGRRPASMIVNPNGTNASVRM